MLTSEKSQTAELQKAVEQSKDNINRLQSDVEGKDSEVFALSKSSRHQSRN